MRTNLLFTLILFSLFSCSNDDGYSNVDSDLQPYFLRFDDEAMRRGRSINVMDSSLIAILSTDLPASVVGQCQQNSARPNEVKISRMDWVTFTDLEREYVIFHELGHCILKRSHLDERDGKGNCTSIMESGLGTCRRNYTTTNRSAYIDELFNH